MQNISVKFIWAWLIVTCIATGLLIRCSGNVTDPPLRRLKELSAHERDSLMVTLLKSYKDTFKKDSVNIIAIGDTESVRVKHYCTYDGKINLPAKYLNVYGLETFKTHNFVSEVEFKINSKIIFKGIIKKESFHLAGEDLKKYGVLSLPDVAVSGKELVIAYGIGVPLTDYYQGYIIGIDSTGKIKYNGSMD